MHVSLLCFLLDKRTLQHLSLLGLIENELFYTGNCEAGLIKMFSITDTKFPGDQVIKIHRELHFFKVSMFLSVIKFCGVFRNKSVLSERVLKQ